MGVTLNAALFAAAVALKDPAAAKYLLHLSVLVPASLQLLCCTTTTE
jgi:hypothetical protein